MFRTIPEFFTAQKEQKAARRIATELCTPPQTPYTTWGQFALVL